MPDDPGDQLHRPCCKHLRSKEMFYNTGTPLADRSGSGIFWCAHSQHCLGPDGAPATDEDCRPGRTCYEQ